MKNYYFVFLFAMQVLLLSCASKTPETKPQRKDLVEMVFASGILTNDQNNIVAQVEGSLVKVNFKESDMVRVGQLLAVISNAQNIINAKAAAQLTNIAKSNASGNSPSLLQIKANITSAQAKLQLDQQQAGRYKELYQKNSVSRFEYENARLTATTSQSSLNALLEQYNTQQTTANQDVVSKQSASDVNRVLQEQNEVRAIINGKIYTKKKFLGDYVTKGEVIAVMGNPHLIYAQLNIDETNMAKVKAGQQVIIQLNTNKGKIYQAQIHEILPTFDNPSQSFIIKAWFTDSLDFRLTGTQLQANIIIGEKKNALVIPREYLGYGNKVILKNKKIVIVKTGIVSNDWVEILDGITENDVIVLDNK